MVVEIRGLAISMPNNQFLLGDIDLDIGAGRSLAITGPSGSGKTSLLNCVAGISTPAAGSIVIDGITVSALAPARRASFRLNRIGIIFQFGELLPELTVLQNVALPARLAGVRPAQAERDAGLWLERLSLHHLADRAPIHLSGGEAQRVGIVRALTRRPALIVADEPTGMLDEANTYAVMDLLLTSAREIDTAVLIATHDPLVAAAADVALRVHERRLVPASVATTAR